ncbi:toxin Fic [Spirochaetia bacterium]|nr:toxin Fic [Spirochaetia bacterium]
MTKPEQELIIYSDEDGKTKVSVRMTDNTVWLSQAKMAELFHTSPQNITMHIKNIYDDGELAQNSTCKDFLQVQSEGKRQISRNIAHYNLDMIIAVGYRVKSKIGTQFRRWATEILSEYARKGFAMNDELLKSAGGGGYWKELLQRIREIRTSEKVFYRQILEIYATSMDYNPTAAETLEFFKIVQNKMHFAAHGHTAAEIQFGRADANKPFMGLTNWTGGYPLKSDVVVAKNYLNDKESDTLNKITTAYLEFAEMQATNEEPMYMKDWIAVLDKFLTAGNKKLLKDSGKISKTEADKKALNEYTKYRALGTDMSDIEKRFLENLKSIQKKLEH